MTFVVFVFSIDSGPSFFSFSARHTGIHILMGSILLSKDFLVDGLFYQCDVYKPCLWPESVKDNTTRGMYYRYVCEPTHHDKVTALTVKVIRAGSTCDSIDNRNRAADGHPNGVHQYNSTTIQERRLIPLNPDPRPPSNTTQS